MVMAVEQGWRVKAVPGFPEENLFQFLPSPKPREHCGKLPVVSPR